MDLKHYTYITLVSVAVVVADVIFFGLTLLVLPFTTLHAARICVSSLTRKSF